MPYIGKSPLHGNYSKLDDFSGDFDGSDATHALAINSISLTPVTEAAVLISINGVLQEPVTDYTVSGTNITFTTAPASGASFFGVVLGEQLAGNTPSDSTITSAKLSGNLVTPGTLDLNGQELILDADADTSITADTDDQIDIKIAGADDFQFTANTFTVLSGSTLTVASGATITNSGTATGFGGADPSSADGDTLGTASLEWSDLYLADGGVIYFGADQDVTLTHNADTSLTCNLMIAATTFEPTGDTAAGDNAAIGYTSSEGLILTGQGSSDDITIKNDADITVLSIPTGTTNINIAGNIVFGQAGKGVYLGVTSATAANLLDDYEEGTWTPASSQFSSGTLTGLYTKIGRLVTIRMNSSNLIDTGTSDIIFTGLPFTAANTGTWAQHIGSVYAAGGGSSTPMPLVDQLLAEVGGNSTRIKLRRQVNGSTAGSGSFADAADFYAYGGGYYFEISVTYDT